MITDRNEIEQLSIQDMEHVQGGTQLTLSQELERSAPKLLSYGLGGQWDPADIHDFALEE